jgi:hypothetical protein
MKPASDATLRKPPLRRLSASRERSESSVSPRTFRSTVAICLARSSLSAAPVRTEHALFTTTSGSRPILSSAAAMSCAALRRARARRTERSAGSCHWPRRHQRRQRAPALAGQSEQTRDVGDEFVGERCPYSCRCTGDQRDGAFLLRHVRRPLRLRSTWFKDILPRN